METKDKNSYKEYETESKTKTSEQSYLEVKTEIPKFEKTPGTSSVSPEEESYSINKPRIQIIRARIINE